MSLKDKRQQAEESNNQAASATAIDETYRRWEAKVLAEPSKRQWVFSDPILPSDAVVAAVKGRFGSDYTITVNRARTGGSVTITEL